MKKEIIIKKVKITFDSTKELASIKVNYTPESSDGKFPVLTWHDKVAITKQIGPIGLLKIKNIYSDDERIMLSNFLLYKEAMYDLTDHQAELKDICDLDNKADSNYTYALCMPTIDNKMMIKIITYYNNIASKKHSERIKFGIRHKKNKEACKNGN